ncbi:pimeloyl-ACP methyl ester carboxylesterase [Palleronia aestuarii]|uniref:Pimeloyl-ACP methyl ester carboxylesterase n=1 Tax=Palleronia aestuarii TaxID=568105 RepID=A0A2W7NH43_9RHOB|nr:alpha/beta hydrolase [Palleronia aestuarii]PZX19741.1 pimeloyl-ACP methyl ester carboxylesterase [Palleronia aestuarii]
MADFTTSDGLRLHYRDEGTGTPILCLSGLTRNSTDFDYLWPHLADARKIALDYRGRGKSDWGAPESYTIPVESRDVVELLDHLGLDRAAVIGTSRGGLIALLMAAMAKDRLAGICLVDIGPEIAPEGMAAIRSYVGRNPGHANRKEAVAARAGLMAGFEGVPESRWVEEVEKHYVEAPEGLAINYDPALAQTVVEPDPDTAPLDLWPWFDAASELPLAVIRGSNSDLLSSETLAKMCERRPDMIVAEVPGRGHVPFLDEPEALDVIAKWRAML